MKKGEVLKLNRAVALFSYEGTKVELVIRMSKTKTAINEAAENINKQLKDVFASLKPTDLDRLLEEQKQELAKEVVDKDKINILNVRVQILQNEQNVKYQEAEESILAESIKVAIEKITEEEFATLIKPRKELVDMEQGKREVVVTNHFKTEDLTALTMLLKTEK